MMLTVIAIVLAAIAPAEAARKSFAYKRQPQSKAACDRFGWSLKREQEWFGRSGIPEVSSGAKRPAVPESAFVLSLDSDSDASFVMPPERKSRSENGFGGSISFEKVPRAGLYHVTLSQDGLVDIIQNGHYLKKKASASQRACPGIRRSIRVDLTDGPLVLQFNGVEYPSVTVAIAPAP
jgi:hypothetical protein